MEIAIRKARINDATLLSNAEKKWSIKPGYLVSQPDELKEENFRQKIEELNLNDHGLYVVAETLTSVVGHALLEPMRLKALQHIVRLTIVVHKGYEEKGIGSQLMDYLITWFNQTSSIEKIEINVRATNIRAIKLYESKGFKQEGLLVKRIKTTSGNFIDEILMGLVKRC